MLIFFQVLCFHIVVKTFTDSAMRLYISIAQGEKCLCDSATKCALKVLWKYFRFRTLYLQCIKAADLWLRFLAYLILAGRLPIQYFSCRRHHQPNTVSREMWLIISFPLIKVDAECQIGALQLDYCITPQHRRYWLVALPCKNVVDYMRLFYCWCRWWLPRRMPASWRLRAAFYRIFINNIFHWFSLHELDYILPNNSFQQAISAYLMESRALIRTWPTCADYNAFIYYRIQH